MPDWEDRFIAAVKWGESAPVRAVLEGLVHSTEAPEDLTTWVRDCVGPDVLRDPVLRRIITVVETRAGLCLESAPHDSLACSRPLGHDGQHYAEHPLGRFYPGGVPWRRDHA